ncbi:MAG: phage integrase SAM-like domain-containing protein [Egibacteraceae bacterium]
MSFQTRSNRLPRSMCSGPSASGPGAEQALAAYLREWQESREARAAHGQLSPYTARNTRVHVHNHIIPGMGYLTLEQLDAKGSARHVRAFLAELQSKRTPCGGSYADSTIAEIMATLRAALDQAVEDRVIDHNPAARVNVTRNDRRTVPR